MPSPLAFARRLAVDTQPLRTSRDFRLLWNGELISQIGSQITVVALFVQVYSITKSSAAVGVIGVVQLVPMVLVTFGLSPLIDRHDRRLILLGAQFGLLFATSLLFLGAYMGHPSLALLYCAAGLNAGFMSLSMPTRQAMTTNYVGPEMLAPAAALNQAMWTTAGVIGPALGGVIVATLGLTWAYGIDLATYVVAIGFVVLLHSQRPEPSESSETDRGWSAALAGVRFLKGRRVLQSTFTIDIVAMVFGMPRVLFPALAATRFGGGAETVGWLFAAPAAGALLGAVTSGWVGAVRRHGLAIIVAVTVWGASITVFGLSGDRLGLALALSRDRGRRRRGVGGVPLDAAAARRARCHSWAFVGLQHSRRRRRAAARRSRRRARRHGVHSDDLGRFRRLVVLGRSRGGRGYGAAFACWHVGDPP